VGPLGTSDFLDENSFAALDLPVLQTNVTDTRPVIQVDVVLFDNSGSMSLPFAEYYS
jgi:hypothetical protein